MSPVKICVVTGNRAEFGQLVPLLRRLNGDADFDLRLVVTGAHLSPEKGYTMSEIEDSGIPVDARIPLPHIDEEDTRENTAMQICDAIAGFTRYFADHRPDVFVAIGDRYEMFGAAIAASNLLVPIVHICGGSTTSGAIDEVYRHSITKMSAAHFTTCDEYRNRVIQLGERPSSVYNVGSLAIENCLKVPLLSEEEIRADLDIEADKPYCVVTFHPVTLQDRDARNEVITLIRAMDRCPYTYVVTLPNSDAGGSGIADLWLEEGAKRSSFRVVSSLGMKRYLSALKYAEMMIGNSSSGTTEGPAMHIPTVDIGDRQKGRHFAESVIHCEVDADEIERAIRLASSESFQAVAREATNPFGDGSTSQKMCDILKDLSRMGLSAKKDFYDLPMGK